MKGIQYIVDETGEKTAVFIDLKEWGQLWNEFYQNLLDRSPVNEDWINRSAIEVKSLQICHRPLVPFLGKPSSSKIISK